MSRQLLFFLWWWPLLAGAKPPVPMPPPVVIHGTPSWTQPMDITRHTLCYKDLSGLPMSFSAIRQQAFQPFMQVPLADLSPSTVTSIVTWLTFRVQNTSLSQPTEVLFQAGRQGQIDLFSALGVHLQQTGTYLMPYNVRQWHPLQLRVLPGQTTTFFVKVTNYVRVVEPVIATLHTPVTLHAWFADNDYETRWLFMGLILIAGGLLIMSFFALSQFLFNRDRVFFYYALFSFFMFVLLLWNANFRLGLGMPMPMHMTSQYFTFSIAFFYTLFISYFINIPADFPRIWWLLKLFLGLFVGQQLLIIYEFHYGLLTRLNWYYLRQDLTFLLAGVIMVSCLIRSKSPFRRYLLLGIGCLCFISYFHMFVGYKFDGSNRNSRIFINYVPLIFATGALFENFCFLIALAYRNKLVEIEKNGLKTQYTIELEEKLRIRIVEAELQAKLLEASRVRRLKTEFDQKLVNSEMTALRSQMNPHFIFNCLNSIKLYTLQNNTDKASDYLTKFARLIRLVLENSRAEYVTLHHELEALQLYSDLEAMRFKQKVVIQIRIQQNVDQQLVQIPPLLLQPYVENAIWHGLMHRPEGGTVTIDVSQPTEGRLRVEITDDGIGRVRAGELKSKSAGATKSFGMQVTADRIRMINQLYHMHTQATILDLVAPNGDPMGTKVVLDIPI